MVTLTGNVPPELTTWSKRKDESSTAKTLTLLLPAFTARSRW